jgi:multisubunit Na+/H+ antiporter MnhC subunit
VLLTMVGTFLMMSQRNLLKAVVGLYLFQTAAILFFIALSFREGGSVPIAHEGLADPQSAAPRHDAHGHRGRCGDDRPCHRDPAPHPG